MTERPSNLTVPENASIAITTVYPGGEPGGVQTAVRYLAEDFSKMGYPTTLHSPDNNLLAISSGATQSLGKAWPISIFGTSSYIGVPDFKVHKDVLNADIMHGHESAIDSQELLLFMMRRLSSRFSRMLNVGTLHALNKRSGRYLPTFSLLACVFDRLRIMDAITVVSEPLKRRTEKVFPFVQNLSFEVVPNGVDTKVFHPAEPKIKEFDDGKTNILYVGRLEERKGVHFAIEAVAQLAKMHNNFRFIIGGSGPQMGDLEQQVADLGLGKVVQFLGKVKQEDLPALYRSAHIGLYLSWKNESFGIVLLEAMASGVPVIAGNNEGYRALVVENEDGANGYLVSPANIQEVAVRLSQLIENPLMRARMGENAREFSLSYDRKVVAGIYLDVYGRAFDRKQKAAKQRTA